MNTEFTLLTGADLRGKSYMRIFKERSPALLSWAEQIVKEKGKISALDVASLVPKIGLPVKTTFEFLEYTELLPIGTWDRLADQGWTAKEIMNALKKRQINSMESISEGTCILGGDCDWEEMFYPNCHRAEECKKHYEYLNSPEKAESDRRDAEAWERYRKSGNLDDLPF